MKLKYICDICNKEHNDLPSAKECEGQGSPDPKYRLDDTFDDGKIKIVAKKVFNNHGKHVIQYKVQWDGRPTVILESNLDKHKKD